MPASATRALAPLRRPSKQRSIFARRSWISGSAKAPLTARLGRQEIAFGDQRLVGHANWLNAGRSFDAARLTLKTKPAQIDLFAASVVRILEDEFDKSGSGNRFAGAYVSTPRVVPRATTEPYLFWRRDVNQRAESGALDSLQQVTTGARLAGRLPARLDYNVESAFPARLARSQTRFAPGPATGRYARR